MHDSGAGLFNRRLADRSRTAGAQPLITYYAEPGGVRTELSATSFSNWVDKTTGLLVDEILIEPGQTVRLDLLRTAPGHWVTLVWVAAAWRARCAVTVEPEIDAAVEVVGPDQANDDAGPVERVACSLHPLGLGFAESLPVGVIDFGVEVRAQPDSFAGPWPSAADPAWIDEAGTRTQRDVLGSVSDTPARRTLIDPADPAGPWESVVECLLTPVSSSGSVVITVGADADRRSQIAETERIDR